MKNIYWKRFIKIFSLFLVLALILGVSQRYYMCDNGNNTVRLRGFYLEDKNSLDVVVLGASEVYSDFAPAEFYKKTGVTSFTYAYEANPVTYWKYELEEILSRQKPKLLIVEMNGVVYGDKMLYKESSVRHLANNMRLQKNKLELVRTYGEDDTLSYFFPVAKYHTLWADSYHIRNALTLLQMDLRGHTMLKGVFSHATQAKKEGDKTHSYDPAEKKELNPDAEKYLREFLEACGESGIEHILFVRFPHIIKGQKQQDSLKRYNRAAEIVAEYGYDYVDMDSYCEEAGIEKPEDFHNTDHLIMPGQKKFTDYLADELVERYSLQPTPLTGKQKKEWEESTKYMDACYAYFADFCSQEGIDEASVFYERADIMKQLRNYL